LFRQPLRLRCGSHCVVLLFAGEAKFSAGHIALVLNLRQLRCKCRALLIAPAPAFFLLKVKLLGTLLPLQLASGTLFGKSTLICLACGLPFLASQCAILLTLFPSFGASGICLFESRIVLNAKQIQAAIPLISTRASALAVSHTVLDYVLLLLWRQAVEGNSRCACPHGAASGTASSQHGLGLPRIAASDSVIVRRALRSKAEFFDGHLLSLVRSNACTAGKAALVHVFNLCGLPFAGAIDVLLAERRCYRFCSPAGVRQVSAFPGSPRRPGEAVGVFAGNRTRGIPN
jgi:hypothetical protein